MRDLPTQRIACSRCKVEQVMPLPAPFDMLRTLGWVDDGERLLCPDCTPSGRERVTRLYGAGR